MSILGGNERFAPPPKLRAFVETIDEANFLTDDEKAALAGTFGHPDETNRYVTDTDPRLIGGVGPPGPQGPQGDPGPAGTDGADGVPGEDGLDGVPGPSGTQGPQGVQGIQGNPGAPGSPGAAGADGKSGTIGSDGQDGDQGEWGLPGIQGVQGVQGLQGIQGIQGNPGTPGSPGTTGAQGPAGFPGLDGIDGIDGIDFPGAQGTPGPQGTPGSPGSPGSTGPAGPQGAMGFPGLDADDPIEPLNIPGPPGPVTTGMPVGKDPYIYPVCFAPASAFTTALALAANGGTIAIPFQVNAPVILVSVSVRNTDTATARTWRWDLYVDSGVNTLQRVATRSADETFTPGAASTRTITASANTALMPGTYWLTVQSTHATSTFGLGSTAASAAFAPNTAQTKTTANPNGASLDFVLATWTKVTAQYAARLNCAVFGQATAF